MSVTTFSVTSNTELNSHGLNPTWMNLEDISQSPQDKYGMIPLT